MSQPHRFSAEAGIAIGPILFVIAILAVLAMAMAGGGGDFSTASISDRITADITAQTNLIRNTINQCNLQYTLAVATGSVVPSTDPYPTSNTTTGTAVSALTCTPMGGTVMFGGALILLPPPTNGFNAWTYIDASASGGGRCFWTTPTTSNPSSSIGIVAGLTRAATKFNSSTAYSSTAEVIYNPASTSQKFVAWITMPTGTANSNCLP